MKSIATMCLVFVCFLLICSSVLGYSCPGGFVEIGATEDEVFRKCGEPQEVENWVEDMLAGKTMRGYVTGNVYLAPSVVQVPFARWTYNFGRSKFVQSFIFREGVVIRMQKGGYGH